MTLDDLMTFKNAYEQFEASAEGAAYLDGAEFQRRWAEFARRVADGEHVTNDEAAALVGLHLDVFLWCLAVNALLAAAFQDLDGAIDAAVMH